MGRIAEALRKAEQERTTTFAASGAAASGVGLMDPPAEATGRSDEDVARHTTGGVAMTSDDQVRPAAFDHATWVGRASASLVTLHGRDSMLVEQYRALRTRLASQNPRARSRVLAITSSTSGEGKTVTTANLGVVMAEVKHHRVLVLDADFRHTALARLFGMKAKPGLAEVLKGQALIEQIIQATPMSNLELISAGDTSGINPAELLNSKRAAAVFDDLRDRYSYVLVDTPPSSDVADAGVLGQLADGVVVIIRMGKTSQPVVKQMVQTLQASQVNLVGCVLTGAADSSSQYNYYSDYASRPSD